MGVTKPKKMVWSFQAVLRLEALADGTRTAREIAEVFGCSTSALETKASKLGISLACGKESKWFGTPEEKAEVTEMYLDGYNRKEIGRKFGINESQVGWIVRQQGIANRKGQWSEQDSCDVAHWYGHVETAKLAALLGHSVKETISEYSRIKHQTGRRHGVRWYQLNMRSRFAPKDFGIKLEDMNRRNCLQ